MRLRAPQPLVGRDGQPQLGVAHRVGRGALGPRAPLRQVVRHPHGGVERRAVELVAKPHRAAIIAASAILAGDAAQVRLSDVVGAMSFALDLTEGEPPGHAVRSCLIGMRVAEELELDAATRSHLFYALLLKDAGCSANSARMAALFGADDQSAKRTSKRVDWSRPFPAFVWAVRTVAPGGSLRRAGGPAAGDQGRGRGHARADAGPLRPRRRDRPPARLSSRDAPRRSARSTSTGTAAASRAGCAARRSRCSARILCLAQTAEIFHARRAASRRAWRVARAAPRRLVRPRAGRRARRRLPRPRVLGHAARRRPHGVGAARPAC